MPRNGSGVYTLPAGNPVVAFTTITTAWANPTMADVGNELTNSLDRQGRGGMLAPFRIFDGNISQPGLGFLNEVGLGLWRETSGLMHIVNSGVNVASIYNDRVVFPVTAQMFADVQYREVGAKNWQVTNVAGVLTITPSASVDDSDWNAALKTTFDPTTGVPTFPTGAVGTYVRITGDTMTGNLGIGASVGGISLNISAVESIVRLTNTTVTTGKTWQMVSSSDGNWRLSQPSVVDAIIVAPTSGNVGIGVTPSAKLHVAQATNTVALLVGQSMTEANANAGTGAFRLTTGTGLSTDEQIQFGVEDVTGAWIQANKPGTTNRDLRLNPSGGNVGIGVTPGYDLHIQRNINSSAFVQLENLSNTAAAGVAYAGTIGGKTAQFFMRAPSHTQPTWGLYTDLAASNFELYQAGVAVMTVTPTGNVGIGVTPTAELHVYRNASNVRLRLTNPNASEWEMNSYSDGNLYFDRTGLGVVALAVAANGNVGIGVTPTSKLDVLSAGTLIAKFANGSESLNFGADATDGYIQTVAKPLALYANSGVVRVMPTGNFLVGGTSETAFSGTKGLGVAQDSPGIFLRRLQAPTQDWLMYVTDTGNYSIFNGTADVVTVTPTGNVGIGVTPTSKLDVFGQNPVLLVRNDTGAAGNATVEVRASGPSNYAALNVGGLVYGRTDQGNSVFIGGPDTVAANAMLSVINDGRLYARLIHNNAGGAAGTTPMLASGTYTPGVTAIANIEPTPIANLHQWMRVGNVVTVSGTVVVNPTAANANMQLDIAIPINSVLDASGNVAGSGVGSYQNATTCQDCFYFGVSPTANKVRLTGLNTNINTTVISYQYTYIVKA